MASPARDSIYDIVILWGDDQIIKVINIVVFQNHDDFLHTNFEQPLLSTCNANRMQLSLGETS